MKTKQITVEFEFDTDKNNDIIERIVEEAIRKLCGDKQEKLDVRVYSK